MAQKIDAGHLRERVQIFRPGKLPDGSVGWREVRKAWAQQETGSGRTIFSTVGLGARTELFTLRRQELSQGDLIAWQGGAHYVTAVQRLEPEYIKATTGAVQVDRITVERWKTGKGPNNRPIRQMELTLEAQAAITEKYLGYERDSTHAETAVTYVLVTPKELELKAGDLVKVSSGALAGEIYNVTALHVLDPVKNEYEMTLRKDV